MTWWNPKTWGKKDGVPAIETVPESVPEALLPPSECWILAHEIGSGVWLLIGTSEKPMNAASLGIELSSRYAIFKVLVPAGETRLLLEGFPYFRGFHDAQVQELREKHFLEMSRDFLIQHRRDK